MRLRAVGTHRLSDFQARQHADYAWSCDQADHQRRQRREHRAEGDEVEDAQETEILLKILCQP